MKIIDENTVLVPPGMYVLGDPCYAVPDDEWSDLLHSCNYFSQPVGMACGKPVMAFDTAYGDGEYRDNNGFSYGVDAGLIGLVPVEIAKFGVYDDSRIVEFSSETLCTNVNGVMNFGVIVIDTLNDDGYDEDEFDEGFDDEA